VFFLKHFYKAHFLKVHLNGFNSFVSLILYCLQVQVLKIYNLKYTSSTFNIMKCFSVSRVFTLVSF